MNPMLRLLFGSGRMPDPLRATLDAEGLLFLEEGLFASVTTRILRAPGVYGKLEKEGRSVALGVSKHRLVVAWRRDKGFNMPRDRVRRDLEVVTERSDRLRLSFDARLINSAVQSGSVAVRVHTPRAMRIAALLRHW